MTETLTATQYLSVYWTKRLLAMLVFYGHNSSCKLLCSGYFTRTAETTKLVQFSLIWTTACYYLLTENLPGWTKYLPLFLHQTEHCGLGSTHIFLIHFLWTNQPDYWVQKEAKKLFPGFWINPFQAFLSFLAFMGFQPYVVSLTEVSRG
jgi:hypothetical protein